MTVAIVGTGLAGLACALNLDASGTRVVLFDKSRGYGGRMASRRREGMVFDHGLSAFDPLPAETIPVFADSPEWMGHGRVATPRMNAFPRALGENFESRLGRRVIRIDGASLTLTDEAGKRHEGFERIVVAVPAPQALDLLDRLDEAFAPVAGAAYTPCWTLMLGGVGMGATDVLLPEDGPLDMIVNEATKPGREAVPASIVAHARADWAQAHLEREPEDVARDLCAALARLADIDPDAARYRAAHRWRYCRPRKVVPEPFLLSGDGRIGACGDWCGADRSGGDARAAWRSGAALAAAIAGR